MRKFLKRKIKSWKYAILLKKSNFYQKIQIFPLKKIYNFSRGNQSCQHLKSAKPTISRVFHPIFFRKIIMDKNWRFRTVWFSRLMRFIYLFGAGNVTWSHLFDTFSVSAICMPPSRWIWAERLGFISFSASNSLKVSCKK